LRITIEVNSVREWEQVSVLVKEINTTLGGLEIHIQSQEGQLLESGFPGRDTGLCRCGS